jgi:TPR repeat protein
LAKNLYRLATFEKDSFSYLRLGDFYFYGYATIVNYKKAKDYYYQAVKTDTNQDHIAQAYFNLGKFYFSFIVAQNGLNRFIFFIGYLYQYGLGTN